MDVVLALDVATALPEFLGTQILAWKPFLSSPVCVVFISVVLGSVCVINGVAGVVCRAADGRAVMVRGVLGLVAAVFLALLARLPLTSEQVLVWSAYGFGLLVYQSTYLCVYCGTLAAKLTRARVRPAPLINADLLAGISHEMRTPLNGVIGFAHLLKNTDVDKTQTEYLNHVLDSGESLTTLVNVVLDLLKYEVDELSFETGLFDPALSAADVFEHLHERAYRKNIELVYHADAALPPLMRCVPERMQQVLRLLVESAVERCFEGGVAIEARLVPTGVPIEALSAQTLAVTVLDSGPRVSRTCLDDPNTEFEVGALLSAAEESRYDSFAANTDIRLKLALCLVKKMGGSLRYERDQVNKFSFEVPVVVEDAAPRAWQALGDARVLAVTANPILRLALNSYFADFQVDGEFARSSLNGFEMMTDALRAGRPYDAVIVDQLLPGGSGTSLIRSVHKDGALESTPLLALNYNASTDLLPDEVADGYVQKPVWQKTLWKELGDVLARGRVRGSGHADDIEADDGRDAQDRRGRILMLTTECRRDLSIVGPLHKAGYSVHVTIATVGMLTKLRERPYDAVIIDLETLWSEGLILAQRIRQAGEGLAALPILGLMRSLDPEKASQVAHAGLNDLLLEPIAGPDLVDTLDNWMSAEDGAVPPLTETQILSAYLHGSEDGVPCFDEGHIAPAASQRAAG